MHTFQANMCYLLYIDIAKSSAKETTFTIQPFTALENKHFLDASKDKVEFECNLRKLSVEYVVVTMNI